jgi:hydroxyacylglutathione hydrolase
LRDRFYNPPKNIQGKRKNMIQEIKTITFGGVNCYLVAVDTGFILVDTGFGKYREDIEKELEGAGCKPGTLKLIVLTHGDPDHTGNAAFLREKYGAKIAMHSADKGMVEHGDLFYGRNVNFAVKALGNLMLFFSEGRLRKADRFTPDIYVEDGSDLSEFGFDAKVLHLPGHSGGSIGFLTSGGDLFCGDLLENVKEPSKGSIVVDKKAFNTSIEKVKQLKISRVYPGHGEPFPMEQFIKNQTPS